MGATTTNKLELRCLCGREHVIDASPSADSLMISQRTSEHVIGVPRRQFLESLSSFEADGGDVVRLGKLRLVEPTAYLAWVQRRTSQIEGAGAIDFEAATLGLRVVRS